MSDDRYRRPYGKLVRNLTIPVDEEMKQDEQKAKDSQWDFNRWARDVLRAQWQEVKKASKGK